MQTELRARFEIVAAELPDLKQQQSIDRLPDLAAAIRLVENRQPQQPTFRHFIFEYYTERTRILAWHNLNDR